MDIKCRCGKFARINMGMEWVCWECRAEDLRGTHEEDWRDYELRQMAKKLQLGLHNGETIEDLAVRSRILFKDLVRNLDFGDANNTRKQETPTPRTEAEEIPVDENLYA